MFTCLKGCVLVYSWTRYLQNTSQTDILILRYASVVHGAAGSVPGAGRQGCTVAAERNGGCHHGGGATHHHSHHNVFLHCGGALPVALWTAGYITHSNYAVSIPPPSECRTCLPSIQKDLTS